MPKKLTGTEIYDEYMQDTCDAVSKPKPPEPKPSPTPWYWDSLAAKIVDSADRLVLDYDDSDITEADCERIVACVNACANLNPQHIPELVRTMEGIKNQAFGHVTGKVGGDGYSLIVRMAATALNKLKGDQ